ncbi:MAG: recombinase family protein [Gammaproteobacteria bacterium]
MLTTEVLEAQADVVRLIFRLYTRDGISINAIARRLNDQGIPTRSAKTRWCRSVVWAMLRNPAYRGMACFGKTERSERKKITRPLRQRGGYAPRSGAHRDRPREEWIEIPVPALVNDTTFERAQELLEQNKNRSPRRTKEPTLLQGILACSDCGYAYYRTSTRTSKHQLYYYRCLGSDDYRYVNGRVCDNRPIQQDYLDDLVWQHVTELLENPELIQAEINRRIEAAKQSAPAKRRQDTIQKELSRVRNGAARLLDAYQEGLMPLDDLRARMPPLRKRKQALSAELQALESAAMSEENYLRLADMATDFLARLRKSAQALSVTERQKVLRLVVKEILVSKDTVRIKHSIPITERRDPNGSLGGPQGRCYLLRSGSQEPSVRTHADILISHRLSTVRIARQILAVESGKIMEQGANDELMALNGRYAHTCFCCRGRGTGESV